MNRPWVFVIVAAFVAAAPIVAQSTDNRFEAGAQIAFTRSGEFDATDIGAGARFAWRPVARLGIEAELDLYPRDFPRQRPFMRAVADR